MVVLAQLTLDSVWVTHLILDCHINLSVFFSIFLHQFFSFPPCFCECELARRLSLTAIWLDTARSARLSMMMIPTVLCRARFVPLYMMTVPTVLYGARSDVCQTLHDDNSRCAVQSKI